MKNLILCLIIYSTIGFTQTKQTEAWDWQKLDLLEARLAKWSQETGEKDLLLIGKMQQRPEEVEIIEDLFPLLLPEGFFGKSIATTCTPDFEKLRKEKTLEAWQRWDRCLKPLYLSDRPKWIQKAHQDLKTKLSPK